MKLIGICGKKESGKDTLFHLLAGKIRARRLAFADKLKQEIADMLNITVEEINADKQRFRLIMQWVGTEWRRRDNPDYWIECIEREIVTEASMERVDLIAVTDVRFENEARMIRKFGGRIIAVVGRSSDQHDAHASEQAIGVEPDYVIWNNGNLNKLASEAEKLAHWIERQI